MGISQAKVFSRWEPLTLKNTRLGHHRVPQGTSLPCSQVSGQGHVDIMPWHLAGNIFVGRVPQSKAPGYPAPWQEESNNITICKSQTVLCPEVDFHQTLRKLSQIF